MCLFGRAANGYLLNSLYMPCFAMRLLAFSALQCVPFVWESTSDGLFFKTVYLACTSCL